MPAPGTTLVTVEPGAAEDEVEESWRVYQAAAFSLYRHAGGMTNKMYRIQISVNFTTAFDRDNVLVKLSTSKDDQFVISHELVRIPL